VPPAIASSLNLALEEAISNVVDHGYNDAAPHEIDVRGGGLASGGSMNPRDETLKRVDEKREEWLALLSELVRRPSENPPGDTRAAADCVADYLKRRGHQPEIVEPKPGMVNVVAVADRGAGRSVILNGHLDTFPVGDRSEWERDPFGGEVVDGKIYGHGVSDMKAGTTASLIAFCLLSEISDAWKGRLTFAAVADEETMGPWGANYLVDHHPKLRADAVLIGEPSTPSTVRFGEKGMVWFTLTARGQMAHSAYPHHGWNAIFEVAETLRELRELETMAWPVPEEFGKRIDEARASTTAMLGVGTTDILSSVTVNAGVITGGTKINLVADQCRVEVDVRVPPGVTTADILRVVGRIVRRHRGMTYELIQRSEPNWPSPSDPFLQTVHQTITAVRGEAPFFNISGPGTDSRVFRRAGMPVAVFGPTPYFLGGPNEHVTVRDYLDVIRVHALSALEFLSER
jgi:succinyl-diaminopimelate desuccinylase